MPKRRRIRGKKLLAVTVSLGAAAMIGCGDDDRSLDSGLVANLVLPMDADMGPMDANTGPADADTGAMDAAPDGSGGEGGTDAAADDAGGAADGG